MKKILALRKFAGAGLFVLAGCGGESKTPFEPPPPACSATAYAQPETVIYPKPATVGMNTNGHCTAPFVVFNEQGGEVAVISSSGTPVQVFPPNKSSVTYSVKYNGALVGTVTITVLPPPPLSMTLDKSTVPAQIAKNSSFSFRVLRSNAAGCSALPNTITLPDTNTVLPSISSSPQDSTLYTANVGSTADKSGFLTVRVGCAGIDGTTKTDSFKVRVVDPILAVIDSVSQKTLVRNQEAHVHFYSKACAFISGNGMFGTADRVEGTIGSGSPNESMEIRALFHSCNDVSMYMSTSAPVGYVQNFYMRNPGQPVITVQFTVVAP